VGWNNKNSLTTKRKHFDHAMEHAITNNKLLYLFDDVYKDFNKHKGFSQYLRRVKHLKNVFHPDKEVKRYQSYNGDVPNLVKNRRVVRRFYIC
jgi:hypothetical protein